MSKGRPELAEGRHRPRTYLALLFTALLTACAPQQPQPATGTATVNVDKLVTQHPFYSLLKHYDEQIAALRETQSHGPINNTAMANDVHRLRTDLDTTAQALNALVEKQTQRYQQEEDAAIAQLERTPRGKPANTDIAETLQRNYRNQQTALRTNASRDMERYRTELLAEQKAAYAAYVQGVNGRISRAYAAREQEFREREGTLALELARKDTPKTLAAQLRLSTLKLDNQRRHATAAQLHQVDARENAVLQQQRGRDQAELARYRAQLLAQAHKDVADAAIRMQSRALTNLDARRNVYLSQTHDAQASLPIGTHRRAPANGPDLRTTLQQWQNRERARYAGDLRDTVAAFTQTDVVDRMRTVQQTDADAGANTEAAIQSLEQERESLRVRIRQQVIALARAVASQRHLALVEHGTAATDLTEDVSARLQTYAV